MFNFENLNLDQLHDAVDHRHDYGYPRRSGRTTAMLALMVGEAQLGDVGNVYLYVGENWRRARQVGLELADILRNEGFSVTVRDNPIRVSLFVGDNDHCVKCFWFVDADTVIREDIRGMVYNDIYVDLTAETKDRFDSTTWELLKSRLRSEYNEAHNVRQ